MKNLLCKIGLHKWVITDCQINELWKPLGMFDNYPHVITYKCEKCGKTKSNI